MKSSFANTTAAALRGFARWFSGSAGTVPADLEHIPYVVSACGYRAPEPSAGFGDREDRWLPGLSLDNFS